MRVMTAVLAILLLVPLQVAGQSSAQAPTCTAESEVLQVTGKASRTDYFLMVELGFTNRTPASVRVDPSQIAMDAGDGRKAVPLTADQAKGALGGYLSHGVSVLAGPIGVAMSVASQVRLYREIDRNILRSSDIPAAGRVNGTLYFLAIGPKTPRVRIAINGMTAASANQAPLRLVCNVPKLAEEGSRPEAVPVIRTVTPGATTTAGPVQISVPVIEFWPDATVVELTLTNNAAADADVFTGLADTTLTDQTGKTLGVRLVRSEFPERVPAGGTILAKLSFEGLSSAQSRELTLLVPRIRVGNQSFEAKMLLRVQF